MTTATFIERYETAGDGLRLAVKDLIDIEGQVTTAGCKAVAQTAEPAERDAPCLAGARAAGARIVGKTNLHELAFGTTGVNPWFGTPTNPLDPALIPGGSSSGSAVAVGSGEADVAFGSDTGGSVRIPSACCGTTGLKTTHGRISLEGVWPLAPSLDTIGPMARDVAGVAAGMALLEPGFAPARTAARRVARIRIMGVHPTVDEAIDSALAQAGFELEDIRFDLSPATSPFGSIILGEAWQVDKHLLANRDAIGREIAERVALGEQFVAAIPEGLANQQRWRSQVDTLFERFEVLALPTLIGFPFEVGTDNIDLTALTSAWNVSGHPALSQPVPSAGRLPASLQLVGPQNAEELLCATGAVVEAAVAR